MSKASLMKNLSARTKVVATIGPASKDPATIAKLIRNGMTVARINFSHGSYEDHEQAIRTVREVSDKEGIPVAILQDLSGPKIRLAALDSPVKLEKNSEVIIGVEKSEEVDLYTDFVTLPQYVDRNHRILIDDGYIELKVISSENRRVRCKVKVPGTAKPRKGMNLPDASVSIPVFTDKDRKDLEFGLKCGVDIVALSFVESGDDAYELRKMIKASKRDVTVIAKIERPVALKNIDSILDSFDGIMVARGDLGVEVEPEKVPILQKELLKKANLKSLMTITATQMLESMISNPRPTRAEASDVSNAILDGSDAVMLSGETAVGEYPVKAVEIMRKIARTTENSSLYDYDMQRCLRKIDHTESIVKSAAEIARDLNAAHILVYSFTGNTALKLSKYRPHCPVFAFTSQAGAVARMSSYWGIHPFKIEHTTDTDEMIGMGEVLLKDQGLLKSGDLVVVVSGKTPTKGATNMLKVARIV